MAVPRAERQESSPKKLHSAFGGCCHCAIFLHGVFSRDVVLKEQAFWILLGQGIPFPCILSWKFINIWINHHGKISTETIFLSKCLFNSPLPDKCQAEFRWECGTQILQCCLMNPWLCARRSGSSSSAQLWVWSHCQVRHSCHSDPPPKASPILRRILRVILVLPWNSIPNSTIPNCRHKDCSKLAGDNLCGCQGHSWSLMGKRVYPAKQKVMTTYSKQGEGVLGRVTTERNGTRLTERICPCKKWAPENVQEVPSKMRTRSEQVTDREKGC